MVAGHQVAWDQPILELRGHIPANVGRMGASRVKSATFRGVDWTRYFAGKDDSCRLMFGIWYRYS